MSTCKFFKDHKVLKILLFLLVLEKFTHAYLFQIAFEIMWLPILKSYIINLRTTKIKAVRFFERQDFEIELINIGCVYQLCVNFSVSSKYSPT